MHLSSQDQLKQKIKSSSFLIFFLCWFQPVKSDLSQKVYTQDVYFNNTNTHFTNMTPESYYDTSLVEENIIVRFCCDAGMIFNLSNEIGCEPHDKPLALEFHYQVNICVLFLIL